MGVQCASAKGKMLTAGLTLSVGGFGGGQP